MTERFEVWQTNDRGVRIDLRATFTTRREAEAYIVARGGDEPLIIRDGATDLRPSPASVRRPVIERYDSVRPDPRRPFRPEQPGSPGPSPLSARPSRRAAVPPSGDVLRSSRRTSGVRQSPRVDQPAVGSTRRPPPRSMPPPSQPRHRLGGPSPEAPEERARIRELMMRGRHEEALAALRGRHLDAELELYRAWAVFDEGDVEDAAESSTLATLAAAALRADRLLGFGYYVLGRIAEREGRFADATRAFKRAAQLSPQHRDARRREHLLLRHDKVR